MDIKDFLSSAATVLNPRVSNKDELLQELSARAASILGLDEAVIAEHLSKREELGSTGVGNGIAIPHARVRNVENPFGLLVRLRDAIDFDAVDGRPVDIVFVLLLPAAPTDEQARALASIARKLRDTAVLQNLRSAPDAAALYRAVIS